MKDEYIRREDAVNAVPKERVVEYMDEFGAGYNSCRNDMLRSIDSLESADVVHVVRHGKWIFVHPLSPDDGGAYLCSECEKGDWDIKPSDKFCKFCGAKMDKE